MIKKLFLLSFAAVLFGNSASAQIPQNKWWIVQDLPDKIVYIDTSAVKITENQISVWSLVVYRSPIKLNAFREEISRIKSQYLFNIANKKYAVIGTLYYDNKSRIVGESISPAITGSGERFTLEIQPGSPVEKVYEKAKEFLDSGSLESDPSEIASADPADEENVNTRLQIPDTVNREETRFDIEPEYKLPDDPLSLDTFEEAVPPKPKTDTVVVQEEEKPPVDPKIYTGPSAKDVIQENTDDEISDNENGPTAAEVLNPGERRVYDPVSGKYITLGGAATTRKIDLNNEVETSEPEVKKEAPKKTSPVTSSSYNADTDKNIRGNIWSDGNLFVIQVSSWRTKSVADQEVSKLKANGHSAFVFEKYIPSKRSTYNRVRIGYFNSLKEAQDYAKTVR